MIEKQNITDLKLRVIVDLTKGEKGGFNPYANKTIELTIE